MTFVILIVAAPAGLALAYYALTNDPLARPLAITQSAVIEAESNGSSSVIEAWVQWPASGPDPAFVRSLERGFRAHGEQIHVVVLDGQAPGRNSLVTYRVGRNRIGPYPESSAVEGVRAAIDAYRLTNP